MWIADGHKVHTILRSSVRSGEAGGGGVAQLVLRSKCTLARKMAMKAERPLSSCREGVGCGELYVCRVQVLGKLYLYTLLQTGTAVGSTSHTAFSLQKQTALGMLAARGSKCFCYTTDKPLLMLGSTKKRRHKRANTTATIVQQTTRSSTKTTLTHGRTLERAQPQPGADSQSKANQTQQQTHRNKRTVSPSLLYPAWVAGC